MGDYRDGKEIPQPGRPNHVKTVTVHKEVDTDAIANRVIEAIASKMPRVVSTGGDGKQVVDTFDNTNSMEKLAQVMSKQKGESESNFDNLGGVKETQKDSKETDRTIDLLKDLDD